ncbi:MAG TPA: bifunctional diaminohydroxyphosphoribosylaminopyrimidine deaminase/5-amino-6-(5-phosphoribosylamino)uracil reductase RibD [Acidimicrobiales bacterium]|jgi:diaminohydroxyphosphoribosylaminopyrimidine deaminase/5-amino-6-(5-phosphoribosylamino)uracil reductase|nr:bifunctional diaminohydroxyphosphoribosylaminopyrimidine deaminase/5-amino-6-(5-phosphoribosylamino)uracil reductase RibD [Acidimicrobiales bacterium]
MRRAVELGESVRGTTSPNPWVGCVVQTSDGVTFEGATQPPGGPHAEVVALRAAGDRARGATMWVTLEPCAHHGRTPPCAEAIVAAGVARVVVGMLDPDANVAGRGIERLRAADVDVHVVDDPEVAEQLAPYVKHRRTGRPWIVLKLASSLDGRTAAPDGTSQWITSPQARLDAHRLRAISDAVIVGAGTVRVDDPALTARSEDGTVIREPLRVVLGHAPPDAKVHPCVEMTGDVGDILDELGRRGVVQAMVEGGATVAGAFHRAGAVDRYVAYLAPALVGGQDAPGWFRGPGAATISEVWRGRIVTVRTVGPDLRVELAPCSPG